MNGFSWLMLFAPPIALLIGSEVVSRFIIRPGAPAQVPADLSVPERRDAATRAA